MFVCIIFSLDIFMPRRRYMRSVETNPIHRKVLALIYRMLAFDSAVDSILLFDVCQSLLSDIDDNEKTAAIIKSMREYSYDELSQLLTKAIRLHYFLTLYILAD
eukprot:TCONS_00048786-protein